MKKLLALLLAVVMIFSLMACGQDQGSDDDDDSGSKKQQDPDKDPDKDPGGSQKPGIDPGTVSSYAECYNLFETVIGAMETTVNDIVDTNNARLEKNDPDNYYQDPSYLTIIYMPFVSLDMAFTATITDDTPASSISMVYEMFGCEDVTFTKNAPGSYTLRYTTTDYSDESIVYQYEEKLSYEGASLRYEQWKDGEVNAFVEFISLGGDRYALQNRTNRAVLTYKDGKITEMTHSWTIWDEDWETGEPSPESVRYDLSEDGIWGRKDLDESWVRELENDGSLERIYEVKDGGLTISGMDDDYDWETGITTYIPMEPIVIKP